MIKGKKRHILVDKLGLLLHALVTGADVQDRDGGVLLVSTLFAQFPFPRSIAHGIGQRTLDSDQMPKSDSSS